MGLRGGERASAHAPANEASTFLQVRTGIVAPQPLQPTSTVVHNARADCVEGAMRAMRAGKTEKERRTAWAPSALFGCYPVNLDGKTGNHQNSKTERASIEHAESQQEIEDRDGKSTSGVPRPGETQREGAKERCFALAHLDHLARRQSSLEYLESRYDPQHRCIAADCLLLVAGPRLTAPKEVAWKRCSLRRVVDFGLPATCNCRASRRGNKHTSRSRLGLISPPQKGKGTWVLPSHRLRSSARIHPLACGGANTANRATNGATNGATNRATNRATKSATTKNVTTPYGAVQAGVGAKDRLVGKEWAGDNRARWT